MLVENGVLVLDPAVYLNFMLSVLEVDDQIKV